LPLGILTGVGFIGAGAIVRKQELVLGLTTAATLWFSTVVGLCLGGGQLILGSVSTLIGFIVLSGMRWFERRVEHYQRGELHVAVSGTGLSVPALRQILEAQRIGVKSIAVMHSVSAHSRSFDLDVRWPMEKDHAGVPAVLAELEQLPGLTELWWKGTNTHSE